MPSTTEYVGLELRDYLAVLRRRRVLIVLCVVMIVLGTLGYSLTRTPLYRAEARVLIDRRESELVLGIMPGSDPDAIRSEVLLMSSGEVRMAIEKTLGYLPEVTLRPASGTSPGVVITAVDPDPDRAAEMANDFAKAYTAERRRITDADLQSAVNEIKGQMTALAVEVAETDQKIQDLMIQIDATPESDVERIRLLQAQITQLQVQNDPSNVAGRQASLQSKLDQLNTAITSTGGRGRLIVSTAYPPQDPFAPTPIRDGVLALLVGLVVGVVAAFVRDYFDDTLRTKEELDSLTGGIPVLGIIPAINEWRDRKTALLESLSHPNSPASEAYRSLRTAIEFVAVDQKVDVIHVTSSTSGEGKSTTSANIAVTLARAGKRVILIDCDLRRPRLHQFFGLDNAVGFTSVVLGTTKIEEALQPVPGVPGLLILASGPPPPNPSELLSTKTVRSKLETLARSSDYVVIDSPPLLPVSDSVIISSLADITLLVVTAKTTVRRSVQRSVEMLQQVDAPLEGIVFNGVGSEGTYGYGYGYGYSSYSAYAPKGAGRASKDGRSKGSTATSNGSTNGSANGSADSLPPAVTTDL